MIVIRSKQYNIACVIPPDTDEAQTVIDFCREVGAVLDYDGEEFCVMLRPEVGPELWTESSLRRSLIPPLENRTEGVE